MITVDMLPKRRKTPMPFPTMPSALWSNVDDGIYGDKGNEQLLPHWPRNWLTKPILFAIQLARNPAHDWCFYIKGFTDKVTYCECLVVNSDDQMPAIFKEGGGVQKSISYSLDGRTGTFYSWNGSVLGRWLWFYRGTRPDGAHVPLISLRWTRNGNEP